MDLGKHQQNNKSALEINPEITLDQLCPGEGGYIIGLEGASYLVRRLLEMGMIEGSYVEVVHEAPFGRDPIAVRVRGGMLALRRQEAKLITLRRETS